MCRFRLLGSIEVRTDGGPVAVGGRRQLALLAFLVLHRGRRVSVAELAEAVWEDEAHRGAEKRVQVAITRLRRALDALGDSSLLSTVTGGYVLAADAGDVDADVFAERVDAGRKALASNPREAVGLLGEALALWRGPPMAEIADLRFAQDEIHRLEELRLGAIEARVDGELGLGAHDALLGELEGLLARHPEREGIAARLMLALYRSGRQADALEVFHRVRDRLVEELGLEPGPALRALQARILAHDLGLGASDTIATEPREATRAEPRPSARAALPVAIDVIGRADDVAAITALLVGGASRLVTITGPGGVGKTTVAIAAARMLAGDQRDGGLFVDLSAVQRVEEVATSVLEAIGAPSSGGVEPGERLRAAFAAREQIVVFDNFEQVLDAAPLLVDLLAAAPGVRMLVTSRAALRLRVEHRYPLAPLAVPGDTADLAAVRESPAGMLFAARARARDPSFELRPGNAEAVSAVCARTGGLPLAIELAAARVTALSVPEVAHRLQSEGLDLTIDLTDVPARQRSLRATIDWTVDRLESVEREGFEAFAVFAGDVAPAAAEAVLATGLDMLERLVTHSLLSRRETGDGARLVMLEPVRLYAAERFAARADHDAVRRRHAEYFLHGAESAGEGLDGPDWVRWRDRLEADIDNHRAALQWATSHPVPDLALALAAALRAFWNVQWRAPEGYRWLTAALGVADDADARLRARALLERSRVDWDELSSDVIAEDARAALDLFRDLGDASGIADALLSLSIQEAVHHRFEPARRLHADAEHLWRSIGQRSPPGALVLGASMAERFEDARRNADGARAELRDRGALRYLDTVLANTAIAAIEAREYEAALTLVEEALPPARAANDLPRIAVIRGNEAFAAIGIGDDSRAEIAVVEELHICRRIGYLELVPEAVLGLACVLAGRRQAEPAGLLAGAADAAFRRRPLHPGVDLLLTWIERDRLAPARATAPQTWDDAAERGRSLSDTEALEAALRFAGAAA